MPAAPDGAGEPGQRRVVVEADGGSRGNPGEAAYGAVLMDAVTGQVIAEQAAGIGVATNNVAEYRGLIAGLELYQEHTPGAALEVRMDSKLVVEQMSGRWKIKHPDMRPLATAANRLAPAGTTYTWIPREKNKHADRILNDVLDRAAGKPATGTRATASTAERPSPAAEEPGPQLHMAGWSKDLGTPTTLVLVRHGSTALTAAKRFSGSTGQDPSLVDEGRDQVRSVAEWLAPLAEEVDVVLTSPLRRAQESAQIIAERLDRPLETEDGLTETAFGRWEGLTFGEVQERYPDDLDAWLASVDVPAGGEGDSFADVDRRVRRTRDRILTGHPGKTVLAVTHVTPIKLLVRMSLGAPIESVYRMELAPASVTVISWFEDGAASLRLFNARPTDSALIGG
jgi:ribonuclease H / adenosylcobalamin/alpha-ribazole phosphatase